MPFLSTVAAPWGMRPVRRINGDGPIQINWYYSSAAVIIGMNEPVATDGAHATGERTVTRYTAGTPIVGVAVAFSPTKPTGGTSLAAPAADSYDYKPSAVSLWIGVIDDPTVVFSIQSDESVAVASYGLNCDLITAANAATPDWNSIAALDGSEVATTSTLDLKILGLTDMTEGTNTAADAYCALDVLINTHELGQGLGSLGK